ncbi:MAG TPA: AAA family ATPase [Thermoanaerobaculia bacterium]|nr:AAA family ATPase [Thermoanaerobaculia bacterium]
MRIKELEVKGFRSLRHVRWTPGKLNVLIGQNGSGKSNLLDACALFREAVLGKLQEGVVTRGGLSPLLWDGQEKSLNFFLQLEHTKAPFTYHLHLLQLGSTSNYSVESEFLTEGDRLHINRTADSYTVFDPKQGHVSYPEPISSNQTLLSLLAGPFGNPEARAFQDSLESWGIFSDLRVDQGSPIRRATVTRYAKRIDPDGQNLVSVLHTLYAEDRGFKSTVDDAMSAAFGPEYEEIVIAPAADQRVQLRVRWRSLKTPQSAANLSDGTLRFLLLVAILSNPEAGDLIAIDEPEAGLHPSMFPLIAELATEAAERTQVIFTTHSPQFLDAFRDEPPTTTVAELVDGETRLSVLDGDELARWLQEYSLGTLFRSGQLEAMT